MLLHPGGVMPTPSRSTTLEETHGGCHERARSVRLPTPQRLLDDDDLLRVGGEDLATDRRLQRAVPPALRPRVGERVLDAVRAGAAVHRRAAVRDRAGHV